MGFSKGDVVRITERMLEEVVWWKSFMTEQKLVRCFINNFMSIFVESTKYCQVQDWQAKNGFVYMTIKVAGRWENLTGKEDLSLHRPGAVYEGEYALGK